jgi:hypothetical protein
MADDPLKAQVAEQVAGNLQQSIEQSQDFGDCGCKKGGELIQAAGQAAFNWQDADADAESKQIEPENKALRSASRAGVIPAGRSSRTGPQPTRSRVTRTSSSRISTRSRGDNPR